MSTTTATSGKWKNYQILRHYYHSEAQEPLCQIRMSRHNDIRQRATFRLQRIQNHCTNLGVKASNHQSGQQSSQRQSGVRCKDGKATPTESLQSWYRPLPSDILDHCNTATQEVGSSTAQRLMSRRTKTFLPATNQLLKPQASSTADQRTKLLERQTKQKSY